MSISILGEHVLLRPADLQPLCPECEVIGSFNPGAARFNGEIYLLVRVAESPISLETDQLASPRAVWESNQVKWVIDFINPSGVDVSDPRIYRMPDGRVRLRYISHLRLVHLNKDGTKVKDILTIPDLLPSEPWEEFGIEDARITQIEDTYYITYVAISRQMGVVTALMTTRDFITFKRHGIIFPTENKDVVLLPNKWNGQYLAFHRPVSNHWIDAPSVESARSPDAIYWGQHKFLFGPRTGKWDSVKVGAGPPPIFIEKGWLLIYHGVAPATPQSPGGHYRVGAALLDVENPLRIIARSNNFLLEPEDIDTQQGYVPNVVFPTGALLDDDGKNLLLFTGVADDTTVSLRISIQSILDNLESDNSHET